MTADIDLTNGALEAPRTVTLPARVMERLGFGEVLEVADLAGVPFDRLDAALKARSTESARIVIALAYVLVRRREPDASWQDAQGWQIAIAPDPTHPDPMSRSAS